jgi:hypothetical protein
MQKENKTGAASVAASGEAGGSPAIKERIFSLIRKASGEGITDGQRWLWIDFTPHIVAMKKSDGYVLWLWRDCVVVKIFLDKEFNVVGFDVERP